MKKISAILLIVCLLLTLLSGTAALARGNYLGTLTVVNCKSYVTLRSSPDKNSAAVATVPLGYCVEGYYYNTEFTECYYCGCHGYILSTYLSNGNGASVAGGYSSLGERTIVNCNEFVTLRSAPNTQASAVTRIALGQTVDCYAYNSEFVYCIYNGLTGYVLAQYISGMTGSGYSDNTCASGTYLGSCFVVNCDSWVSLRAYASTDAPRIAQIPLGAQVEAYTYNGEFMECYYGTLHGFVLAYYIGSSPSYCRSGS